VLLYAISQDMSAQGVCMKLATVFLLITENCCHYGELLKLVWLLSCQPHELWEIIVMLIIIIAEHDRLARNYCTDAQKARS
jgi:hypothetical protein